MDKRLRDFMQSLQWSSHKASTELFEFVFGLRKLEHNTQQITMRRPLHLSQIQLDSLLNNSYLIRFLELSYNNQSFSPS